MFSFFTKHHRLIIILVLFACLFTLLIVALLYAPSKFAVGQWGGGVGLVRDDQELSVYYQRISFVYDHRMPYADKRIEYPFLGTLYLAFPSLLAASFRGYSLWLAGLNGLTAVALVLVTWRLLSHFQVTKKALWLFLLPGFLYFTVNRFDIWPALLVQTSLLLLVTKKYSWAFFMLGVSFLAKGYGILLFPVFFVYWLNQHSVHSIKLWWNKNLLLMLVPIVAVLCISGLLAGWRDALFPYIFQSSRGFAYGALYTVYLEGISLIVSQRWLNIIMVVWAKILFLCQLILPVLVYGAADVFRKSIRTTHGVLCWSIGVILLYVQFSPYYSPQWFVWILPLVVLLPRAKVEWLLVGAYGILAYMEFPIAVDLLHFGPFELDMLAVIRTAIILVLLLAVGKRIIAEYTDDKLSRSPNALPVASSNY